MPRSLLIRRLIPEKMLRRLIESLLRFLHEQTDLSTALFTQIPSGAPLLLKLGPAVFHEQACLQDAGLSGTILIFFPLPLL